MLGFGVLGFRLLCLGLGCGGPSGGVIACGDGPGGDAGAAAAAAAAAATASAAAGAVGAGAGSADALWYTDHSSSLHDEC